MFRPKRITSLFMICMLLAALCLPVLAVQLENVGSIRVNLTQDGEPVSGGSLTLYRVAEVDDTLSGPFRDCGIALDPEKASQMAEALAAYAAAAEVPGDTRRIGDDGFVGYEDLEPGLYLVVQRENAPAYSCINPFLVSIPMAIGGEILYNVDAGPKLALAPDSTEPAPTVPAPTNPVPDNPRLPQTGQLNWPVPVLGGLGLILLLVGCRLGFRRKRGSDEE